MATIEDFISEMKITIHSTRRASNPHMDDAQPDDRHWQVTLSRPGHKMSLPFTQGAALTDNPTAADVLDCLASDAAGYDNARDFEDWASEYGYDTDSRRAERTWNAIGQQTMALMDFLGGGGTTNEAYNALLFEIERQ